MNKIYWWAIAAILIVIILVVVLRPNCPECAQPGTEYCCDSERHHFCQEPGTGMLPILKPTYNMRECAKQMILLEDHLNSDGGRRNCPECCRKHMLNIEGLAEEALQLDKKQEHAKPITEFLVQFRLIVQEYIGGAEPQIVAQKIRVIRKPILNAYFHCID